MTRGKILILLAMSTCAMALSAVPASAFFKASSGKYPVTISVVKNATQKFEIATSSLITECTSVSAVSVLRGEGSQLTAAPSYSGCSAKLNGSGFGGVVVHPNGCIYNFHQAKGATTGTVSIECKGTNTIEFEAALGCILKVGNNSNLGTLTYTNIGSGTTEEVEIKPVVININFTSSGCAGLVPTSGTNAKYEGPITVMGLVAGGLETGILVV